MYTEGSLPVYKATIVPRGQALGMVCGIRFQEGVNVLGSGQPQKTPKPPFCLFGSSTATRRSHSFPRTTPTACRTRRC